jgi:integrase
VIVKPIVAVFTINFSKASIMAKLKFHLEKRKDKDGNPLLKDVPIRLSYSFNGKRLLYYTGYRVDTKYFDNEYWKKGRQPVKPTAPQAGNINANLKIIETTINEAHTHAKALKSVPTVEYFRNILDRGVKGKINEPDKTTLQVAFAEFLEYIKENKAHRTYQKMKTTESHLRDAAGKGYDKVTFDEVNASFIERYRKYLIKEGYLNNTVVKYLRSLREFLNWCKDEKRQYYTGSTSFEGLKENEINVIYLTLDEIQHLQQKEMPNQTLENVKDVFLFGCFTGMRYGDIFKLRKSNVLWDKDIIRFYITKGGKTIWQDVPLVEQSINILKRYKNIPGDKALPVVSNQKQNEFLKKVMQIAGFNEGVTIAEKQGNGKIIEKEYKRWELITCHTSRKSYITFAIENGMPELVIKSITGHSKNSRAFSRYYEISGEKKSKEMKKIFGNLKTPKLKAV